MLLSPHLTARHNAGVRLRRSNRATPADLNPIPKLSEAYMRNWNPAPLSPRMPSSKTLVPLKPITNPSQDETSCNQSTQWFFWCTNSHQSLFRLLTRAPPSRPSITHACPFENQTNFRSRFPTLIAVLLPQMSRSSKLLSRLYWNLCIRNMLACCKTWESLEPLKSWAP